MPFRKNKPTSTSYGFPSASFQTDNNPSRQPTAAADGHQSLWSDNKLDQSWSDEKIASIMTIKEIASNGLMEGLMIAKESSDWNPILKAVLGGVVAVVSLKKV
ncbi:hypothetical protein E4T56_gene689 [Termitomyces sp. T112]|nr:hypothetical protein E4T56_gene689 [Termitomyces sp. T112]